MDKPARKATESRKDARETFTLFARLQRCSALAAKGQKVCAFDGPKTTHEPARDTLDAGDPRSVHSEGLEPKRGR